MELFEKINALIGKYIRYVNIGLLVLCIIFFIIFLLSFRQSEEELINIGHKVTIDVATGQVTIRESETSQTDDNIEDSVENNQPTQQIDDAVGKIEGEAKLAVIIKSIGLNEALTNAAIELPEEVALSFIPYGAKIDKLIAKAEESGHEILLDAPMETSSYPRDDPGPYTLLVNAGNVKNMFRLKSILSITNKHIGVVTNMDEVVTRSMQAMLPIIDELNKQNVTLIYNETTANTDLLQQARSIGLSTINKYYVVDDVLIAKEIDRKLDEATKLMQDDGLPVVVVGRPYPLTLQRIRAWLKKIKAHDVEISNISQLIMKN